MSEDVVATSRQDEIASKIPQGMWQRTWLENALDKIGYFQGVFLVKVAMGENLNMRLL